MMKKKYVVSTLSNGNVALLINMAKHSGIPWDHCFSGETFHHYKPDPESYLGVVDSMYLKPHQVMLVAAHNGDLKAYAPVLDGPYRPVGSTDSELAFCDLLQYLALRRHDLRQSVRAHVRPCLDEHIGIGAVRHQYLQHVPGVRQAVGAGEQ